MCKKIKSISGTGLGVDENKNVFIVNSKKNPIAHLGKIVYYDNEPAFLPSGKTPNGETGTLSFDIMFMKELISLLETIKQKPSDEEIDDLFHGNQI